MNSRKKLAVGLGAILVFCLLAYSALFANGGPRTTSGVLGLAFENHSGTQLAAHDLLIISPKTAAGRAGALSETRVSVINRDAESASVSFEIKGPAASFTSIESPVAVPARGKGDARIQIKPTASTALGEYAARISVGLNGSEIGELELRVLVGPAFQKANFSVQILSPSALAEGFNDVVVVLDNAAAGAAIVNVSVEALDAGGKRVGMAGALALAERNTEVVIPIEIGAIEADGQYSLRVQAVYSSEGMEKSSSAVLMLGARERPDYAYLAVAGVGLVLFGALLLYRKKIARARGNPKESETTRRMPPQLESKQSRMTSLIPPGEKSAGAEKGR